MKMYKYCSLPNYYKLTKKIFIPLSLLSALCISYGIIGGLFLAPPDYQQGDGFRIIYIHVPAAFLSLFIYVFMALMSGSYLVFKLKLADVLAKSSAFIGASFTLIALTTGAIWGKPMWGTWWIWDARLTSELILLFLYLGCIILRDAFDDEQKSSFIASLLALFGVVNIPIIHFSVNWWNTLHQGATLSKLQAPSIASTMLYPLLSMILGFFLLYFVMLILCSQAEILIREKKSSWVKKYV